MSNERDKAFQKAVTLWESSSFLPLSDKLLRCRVLSEFGVFSLSQIAKISRTDAKTLRKHGLKSYAPGGRFDPESITALRTLAEQVRLEEQLSRPLIRLCVQTGCSISTIAKLIGYPPGRVYRMMEEE